MDKGHVLVIDKIPLMVNMLNFYSLCFPEMLQFFKNKICVTFTTQTDLYSTLNITKFLTTSLLLLILIYIYTTATLIDYMYV